MTDQKQFLTEREVSKITSISMSTLQHYRWKGGGPKFIKIGGAVRYPIAQLEIFLSGCPLLSNTSQHKKEVK